MIRAAVFGVLCVPLAFVTPALAQKGAGGKGQTRPDFGQSQPSAGLSVRFEGGAACTPISSPYASPTRYDGSKRSTGAYDGDKHGGIDLSLDPGTALLAIAPGHVFAVGEGGRMEGMYISLLHLPEDTGLPFTLLSKYQHLVELPNAARGDRVKLGQTIARAGKTGTVGGHYGSIGYPHLHLSLRVIHDDKLPFVWKGKTSGEFLINRDSTIIDPLSIYIPNLKTPSDADALPRDARQLSVAYVDRGGMVRPSSASFVWPVACP